MNPEQESTYAKLLDLLLALPWTDRADVFCALQFNGIFCADCGYGSREAPNTQCQCDNDE